MDHKMNFIVLYSKMPIDTVQQLLRMSTFCPHTFEDAHATRQLHFQWQSDPFRINSQQALLQLVSVMHQWLINLLLDDAPCIVVF